MLCSALLSSLLLINRIMRLASALSRIENILYSAVQSNICTSYGYAMLCYECECTKMHRVPVANFKV